MFDGDCREAFTFYAGIFGGDSVFFKFDEMPGGGGAAGIDGDRIMNVMLPIGDSVLQGCDVPKPEEVARQKSAFNVMANAETKEQADYYFHSLASGGYISMPIESTFWVLILVCVQTNLVFSGW